MSRRASASHRPTSTATPAARSMFGALAGDLRKRVAHGGHDAADAGADDRIGAGRRLAVMAARLQRDVERGAAGRCSPAAARALTSAWAWP